MHFICSLLYYKKIWFHQTIEFIPNNGDIWYYLQDKQISSFIIGDVGRDFLCCLCLFTIQEEGQFEWSLSKVQGLFVKNDMLSQIIVNDSIIALMNALEIVFPSSTNLLFEFHISKIVRKMQDAHE